MRVLAAAALLLLMGGCEKEADRLKQQAQVAKEAGDGQKACDLLRRAADATLSGNDAEQYRQAKLSADIQCSSAEMEQQERLLEPPDNLEAAPDNVASDGGNGRG